MNNLKAIMKQKVMTGMPSLTPKMGMMPDPMAKKPFQKKPGFGKVAVNPNGPAPKNLFKRLTGK